MAENLRETNPSMGDGLADRPHPTMADGAIEPALRRKRLMPYPWVWDWLDGQRRRRMMPRLKGPTHLLFLFVDHYEPEDWETVQAWAERYPKVAGQHRDADGRPPQYAWFWFFPGASAQDEVRYLRTLGRLAFDGWGEVELHLHHENDTAQTLHADLERRLRLSNETGAMLTAAASPQRAYGFIHGMWALDNSRLGAYCGVNNELQVLKATGCYADFTLPSWGPMQSRWVNRIYMATDDPQRPKSYDTGTPVRVGQRPEGDLLIMQGPTVLHVEQLWKRERPVYDHGDITFVEPPSELRLNRWVQQHVHVEGRPEWVFVKVYTHGAVRRDLDTLLGPAANELFGDLGRRYNDGERYVLHYVTPREAYNIIQAAADGRSGNPNEYRDYRIPPPANEWVYSSSRLRLEHCAPGQALSAQLLDPGEHELLSHGWGLHAVKGRVVRAAWRTCDSGRSAELELQGAGWVSATLQAPPAQLTAPEGVIIRNDGPVVHFQLPNDQVQRIAVAWS